MSYKPWQLAAMEEHGITNTPTGQINRVARALAQSPNDTIDSAEFRRACRICDVDPDSFSRQDLQRLQDALDHLG